MASEPNELISNLRDNADMLKDGLQLPNLTEAWHNEAMKHAAADSLEAAALISSLVAERDDARRDAMIKQGFFEVECEKHREWLDNYMAMKSRAIEAERLLAEARASLERKQDLLDSIISFVHRWTWVKEGNGTSVAERLDVIKHYPPISGRAALSEGEP